MDKNPNTFYINTQGISTSKKIPKIKEAIDIPFLRHLIQYTIASPSLHILSPPS
jgi:hypothetical protein